MEGRSSEIQKEDTKPQYIYIAKSLLRENEFILCLPNDEETIKLAAKTNAELGHIDKDTVVIIPLHMSLEEFETEFRARKGTFVDEEFIDKFLTANEAALNKKINDFDSSLQGLAATVLAKNIAFFDSNKATAQAKQLFEKAKELEDARAKFRKG